MSCDDQFIDPSLRKLSDGLKGVDASLSDHALLKPLEATSYLTTGAPGTLVHVSVRMLFLKSRYGVSCEEVEQEVREHIRAGSSAVCR